MLSLHPRDLYHNVIPSCRPLVPSQSLYYNQATIMGGCIQSAEHESTAVAQALEIARESPDGAQDPIVSSILEGALSRTWNKVQTQPDSYVMSRDEFAVFNYFQARFTGNKLAMAARKRYWDNMTA